jgi:hypothetical protein
MPVCRRGTRDDGGPLERCRVQRRLRARFRERAPNGEIDQTVASDAGESIDEADAASMIIAHGTPAETAAALTFTLPCSENPSGRWRSIQRVPTAAPSVRRFASRPAMSVSKDLSKLARPSRSSVSVTPVSDTPKASSFAMSARS